DTDYSGVSTDKKPGLTFVDTNIRFRDGSFSNFNSTDLDGHAVGSQPLLVEVDLDVRNQRLPAELQEQLRIVERPCRRIDDMSVDPPVFGGRGGRGWGKRPLAEFEEVVLA